MEIPPPKPHEVVIVRTGPDGRTELRRIDLRRRLLVALAVLIALAVVNGLLWGLLLAPEP